MEWWTDGPQIGQATQAFMPRFSTGAGRMIHYKVG